MVDSFDVVEHKPVLELRRDEIVEYRDPSGLELPCKACSSFDKFHFDCNSRKPQLVPPYLDKHSQDGHRVHTSHKSLPCNVG